MVMYIFHIQATCYTLFTISGKRDEIQKRLCSCLAFNREWIILQRKPMNQANSLQSSQVDTTQLLMFMNQRLYVSFISNVLQKLSQNWKDVYRNNKCIMNATEKGTRFSIMLFQSGPISRKLNIFRPTLQLTFRSIDGTILT